MRYRIRKPRVYSENDITLRRYRKTLTENRKTAIIEAHQYQEKIEDAYLQSHADRMARKHHNNECNFRKRVIQGGYALQQNLLQWRKTDELLESRLDKFARTEELKKINRSRVKKILEYESENY